MVGHATSKVVEIQPRIGYRHGMTKLRKESRNPNDLSCSILCYDFMYVLYMFLYGSVYFLVFVSERGTNSVCVLCTYCMPVIAYCFFFTVC